jgi:hypothetical protein
MPRVIVLSFFIFSLIAFAANNDPSLAEVSTPMPLASPSEVVHYDYCAIAASITPIIPFYPCASFQKTAYDAACENDYDGYYNNARAFAVCIGILC